MIGYKHYFYCPTAGTCIDIDNHYNVFKVPGNIDIFILYNIKLQVLFIDIHTYIGQLNAVDIFIGSFFHCYLVEHIRVIDLDNNVFISTNLLPVSLNSFNMSLA